MTLKFRGNRANVREVFEALEEVHRVLTDVANKDWLDAKLAEYAFFPLSQIFNQTQRLSVRCVEVAVRSLTLLIEKGWRQNLSAPMGKQLIILMTILAGGQPGQNPNQGSTTPQSEELTAAALDCIRAICNVLQGREASVTIFNEIGTATTVDQTVYVLLEGILEGPSDTVQMAAAKALHALHSRITDRVVLASLLPRTVSSLTKALRPTTQSRRSSKFLSCCLDILKGVLEVVLSDENIASAEKLSTSASSSRLDAPALDESWLKATASQVKLALANIVPLRTHEKPLVQQSLLSLSLMIVDKCSTSLAESIPMMLETVVALADPMERNDAYVSLQQLIRSSEPVANNLKSIIHTWIIALPRVMQANDETVKQRAIKRLYAAFQAVAECQSNSDILGETMANSLCESVTTAIQTSSKVPQSLSIGSNTNLEVLLREKAFSQSFQPVLIDHGSQRGTLSELRNLLKGFSRLDASLDMARLMLDKTYGSSDASLVASFWLALSLVNSKSKEITVFDEMLDLDTQISSVSHASLVEELYSISLPILTELSTADPEEWRVPALALEAVAFQAQELGEMFRPELIDILYPVLQLMGSNNPALQEHAMTCLNIMTKACGYADTSTMLIENVDYLINSVGMKFNTFDISPQAPQVLLMMIRLCGSRIIPHLDDLIASIFSILDAFHGYPRLVELLFAVLGCIVDESAKSSGVLSITNDTQAEPGASAKRLYVPRTVSAIVDNLKRHRESRLQHDIYEQEHSKALESHPKRPWTKTPPRNEHEGDVEMTDSQDEEPPTQPEDESKVLTKSHNLLLSILKSIPPHLSSPSPQLRRFLLRILSRAMAVVAPDENSFLPLINDIWPSVSSRVTLPPFVTPDTSASLDLTSSNQRISTRSNEPNIQEQTYVIVASCKAIGAICETAGDFTSSRIEHEFPKWKQIYSRCWERVKHDAELAFERHQQRQRALPQAQRDALDSTTDLPQVENLSVAAQPFSTKEKRGHSLSRTSMTTSSQPRGPPPLPYFASKSFTPHHNIWSALASLFTTILAHVRLPLDIGDEISHCLASWITFFYPDYYFSYSWKGDEQSTPTNATRKGSKVDESTSDLDVDRAIRAMDAWNADLTWFLFVQGRARSSKVRKDGRLDTIRMKMNAKLGERSLNLAPTVEMMRFAEAVF